MTTFLIIIGGYAICAIIAYVFGMLLLVGITTDAATILKSELANLKGIIKLKESE